MTDTTDNPTLPECVYLMPEMAGGLAEPGGSRTAEYVRADLSDRPAPAVEGLVERMARAIYESQRDRHPHPETWTAWDEETYPGYFDPWRDQARAALAAYEESQR
ncbi:hypothetical protein [Limimaricola cinnabarinus]|uniref:hypothetical protein n=1 Tax=Limimaricola cinnabarinus TaxID=1125964 RepID=UPI002492D2C0|nr:hypothetical protein [Limimaricola cinnabarinus]